MPPTISLTVGTDPPLLLPAEFEVLEPPPQAVRLRAIAPAAAMLVINRFFIVAEFPFLVESPCCGGMTGKSSDDLRLPQMAGASERLGGRHFRRLCSRRLMRNSAPSVITAMITMQANTVFGSK